MKALILILILISSSLIAAEKPVIKTDKPSTNGGIVINESMQKLMDVPGVKEIYESCKTSNPEKGSSDVNKRTELVLTCLWSNIKNKPDIKKKVETAYAEASKPIKDPADNGRSPANAPKEKQDIVTKKMGVAEDYEKDPGVMALAKFYGDKLDEILVPEKALTKAEIQANVILEIDHKKFIDLYKSELGKTIINAFTSYCIDTDPETCGKDGVYSCTIKDDKEDMLKDRDKNIQSLATINLDSKSLESVKWQQCIFSVAKHCDNKDKVTGGKMFKQSETTRRSCLIVDYVASARKNIMLSEEQQKFYEDLQKEKTIGIVSNSKAIDAKKASSDAILEITSKDVTDNMKKPIDDEKASMEACYKDGAIVNQESCKKFLSVDKEKNENAIAELGIREMAQEGILEKNLNESEKNVASYLKEEGYSATDIEKMTSDASTIQNTKEDILERYKNKKAAIIAEMAEKINSKTATAEGKISGPADISKLEAISLEMNKRSIDLSNLVKFSNIVSSYLQIEVKNGSGAGDKGRNVASLLGEAKNMSAEDAKALNEKIKAAKIAGPKASDQGESTVNLDVNTINQFFMNYNTLKNDEKK